MNYKLSVPYCWSVFGSLYEHPHEWQRYQNTLQLLTAGLPRTLNWCSFWAYAA